MFIIFSLLFSLHHVCVGHAYILMLLFFIDCMFGLSFALLYNHCSHFFMIVLVYSQVTHMFYIMFTWSQFTCYIILVLLLLALPWGSNVFCASVLGYRYICFKFITASRFRCEWVLPLFPNSRLSLESIIGCFCQGIAKWGDCKVVIYNYVLCWLYSMTKTVVIALILFLVFCGILLYWV